MADNPEKTRLDQLLVDRGLVESREKARRLIMAGKVKVAGEVMSKSGARVSSQADIHVAEGERYVGRGGFKLEHALKTFAIAVTGRNCLDIGSSTGGFTDCLLQHGAARIHAVDVGRGQMAWKLRGDPRVVVHEGINARHLTRDDLGCDGFSIVTMDVSFISLALIFPAAFALMAPEADCIVLIKPQFELSPREVGKGGVVRDPALREAAVAKIRVVVEEAGRRWMGVVPSPITGAAGNQEFLAWLKP